MPFADWLANLPPRWLQQPWGAAWRRGVGALADSARQRGTEAVLVRFPSRAPSDGLFEIGRDRLLPQGASETEAAYRVRLHAAWTQWGGDDTPLTGVGGPAGSHLALLKQIELVGLPVGTSGATIVQHNGRYSQLVAGALVLGLLQNCVNRNDLAGGQPNLPGWTFEHRDRFWSTFGLLFPANVAALTVGSALATKLNQTVERWAPGKALFVGTWVIESGITLGWPLGVRTLATEPVLGGNVTRYLPPPGGNEVGYFTV